MGHDEAQRPDVAARLAALVEDLGLEVPAATTSRWAATVERVRAELRRSDAARIDAPGAAGGPAPDPGDGAEADGSPWVWRPSSPLAPTGHGPLDGVRLAVKDIIAVAGRPLRAGSASRADAAAQPQDAPVVAALRAAGASVVGTVKLHEFAFGVTGVNAHDGTATNPAAPGRMPGGSSSGSGAVVAAGDADVALGTDTGGSCRIPAACCGVVGFKPTYGLVSTAGVFPLAPSLDHVGWLARDVATVRRVAEALGVVPQGAGATERAGAQTARYGSGLGGAGPSAPLGVVRAAVEAADEGVRAAWAELEARVRAAGRTLVDVEWPGGDDVFATSTAIMFAEAAHVHRHALAERPAAYGPEVAARLVQGAAYDLDTYLLARRRSGELRATCLAVLAGVAAVIGPTMGIVPPALGSAGDDELVGRMVAHTRLADVTGLPALSLPVPGLHLPVGVQVEAALDAVVLREAAAIEAALAGSAEPPAGG